MCDALVATAAVEFGAALVRCDRRALNIHVRFAARSQLLS